MNPRFHQRLDEKLAEMKRKGTLKVLRTLDSPMRARAVMEGRGEVLILSSNNYLGLADHPQLIAAGQQALERYGAGTASVRFICGTFTPHLELERTLARFLGVEAALTYGSCWAANTGAIPVLAEEGDVVLSDELNHASLIDGARLSRAQRLIYRHADLKDLEEKLASSRGARTRLIVTDGVFSMEGDLAPLPGIVELARRYDAAVLVDDSHGTGVMGAGGRGTIEHFGLAGEIDVITGTLGKALGGAAGGFAAGSRAVVELLTQSSRPQIFSNALPVTIAASARRAVELVEEEGERLSRLHRTARSLRELLRRAGLRPLEAPSAIIPILVGRTETALRMSERLLERGVFVTGFGYPVVPEGKARLRVQASAALQPEDLEKAFGAFAAVARELGPLEG